MGRLIQKMLLSLNSQSSRSLQEHMHSDTLPNHAQKETWFQNRMYLLDAVVAHETTTSIADVTASGDIGTEKLAKEGAIVEQSRVFHT